MLCVACRAKIYDLEWKRFDAHTQTNSIKLGIVTRINYSSFLRAFSILPPYKQNKNFMYKRLQRHIAQNVVLKFTL